MEQEKIIEKSTGYGINIAGGKVDSLRVKNDLKTVIRVYEGGNIGVAGRIGEGDDAELLAEAKEKLSQNIAYPCSLSENKKRSEDVRKTPVPAEDFVKTIKKLMARLNKTYPDFIFANKINMTEKSLSYANSKSTEYSYASCMLNVSLTIKDKASANIMDLFYGAYKDCYDEDAIVADIGKLLTVYNNKLPLPEEDVPVLIGTEVLQYALGDMSAEVYMSGSSLFNGKLNQKLFNEKLNVLTDRTPLGRERWAFFDAEGTVNENDKFYFVKDGVFCNLATYKRSAEKFNLPLSGNAYAEFDSVPMASYAGVTVAQTANNIKDIVKGKAIYIAYTSGGDMTPDGTLGIPVQLAYLYEDGKLLGALPQFSLSASIFDVLGNDFIGVAQNDVFAYAEETVIASKFKINKAN